MSERLTPDNGPRSKEVRVEESIPEWTYLEDTECEAGLNNRTTRQSVERFVYDGYGKKHDLGPGVVEQTGKAEGKLNCGSKFCPHVKDVPFEAEGKGYAPYNQVNREAAAWLQENCGKWQARLRKGKVSGKMPEKDLPFKP